jgi:hypothetical protein
MVSLAVIGFSLCALGQTCPSEKRDDAAIQHVKNLLAFSLDSRLPRVSLEYFLAYETDGAPARWTMTQCGKQFADGSIARGRIPSICVQADFDLDRGGMVTWWVLKNCKAGSIGAGPLRR